MSSQPPLEPIYPALDRFREAHFWIHMLEQHYHFADPFRWYLNTYLKAIKEVPHLLAMGLQNSPGFSEWYQPRRAELSDDPLMRYLATSRDLVVHRGMLVPASRGSIGIAEGRGIKLSISFPVHPLEDSDDAMHRYLHHVFEHGDFFAFLSPDDDSQPCIQRVWKLEDFEDDLVDLAAKAWQRTGQLVNDVVTWRGEEPHPLDLDCRHSSKRVQVKLFDRGALNETLEKMRNDRDATDA